MSDPNYRQAFLRASEASTKLEQAAKELGFATYDEMVDALTNRQGEFDHEVVAAMACLSHAHSYLNNGDLNGLYRLSKEQEHETAKEEASEYHG